MQDEHIFLSYRSTEVVFALKLAADLKNRGVCIWMDRLETGIKVGEDWRKSIEQAINKCSALLSIISPDYLKSAYCQNEMARADRLGLPIIPILLYSVQNETWPIELERIQYIDFQNWQNEELYSKRFEELLLVLKHKAPNQIGKPPDLEVQYLTRFIAELKQPHGVVEYVDLGGQVDENECPTLHHDKGWNAEFALLLDDKITTYKTSTQEKKWRPISSLQLVCDTYPRFVLIGEPGAGKTTTLRRLALEAAWKRLDNPRTAPLPLLLYLPQWEKQQTFEEFIASRYPFSSAFFSDAIVDGDIVLYLDGLNEMGSDGIKKAQHIKAWLHQVRQPKNVVITCRAYDYVNELVVDLPKIEIKDMNRDQIEQFVRSYLRDKSDHFFEQLVSQTVRWNGNETNFLPIARNPYILSALIYIYIKLPNSTLPRNTGILFRGLVRTLWEREAQKQTLGWIPSELMEHLMGHLAFEMIDQEMPIDVSSQFAIMYVDSNDLLMVAKNANLIEIHGKNIRFYHQSIQEYFAAVYAINNLLFRQLLLAHGRKWEAVVIASCGLKPTYLDQVAATNHWLAVRCIFSGVPSSENVNHQVVCSLMDELINSSDKRYNEIETCLIELGDKSVPPLMNYLFDTRTFLVEALTDDEGVIFSGYWVRRKVLYILSRIGYLPPLEMMVNGLTAMLNNIDERKIGEAIYTYNIRPTESSYERVCDAAATDLSIVESEGIAKLANYPRFRYYS